MNDITIRRPVRWISAEETNVGAVRQENEDSVISVPDIGVWAVADGMGGHDAGNVASDMIVNALSEIKREHKLSDFVAKIEDEIIDVNQRLQEYSEIMLDGRIVGSTVVTLLIKGRIGVCLWAGDSRLYRFRNNQITQISSDHSHVSELLKHGSITAEEAENHPESNVITRAVGTYEELLLDIDIFEVRVGDIYLLCSDGLYNSVNEETIVNCIRNNNIESAVEKLIEISLQNKAADNVSVILVKGVHKSVV
ncbi:PP2C family protein-serine/threonine phosphatase [Aliikangiella coralliicola]|uniref:Serine/threonine-protein phosphatase n=1 Tax=Aliikangiella coralliicola TaxID=2592383 RepID=A0A545U8T4_9GAMM|nr:protein phosphatase 2C domain-containing protein [Aliikangiella coralliicola]TQV85874.1 serine/threonine-protein phosphatase [Aliikangiella coralliicola]